MNSRDQFLYALAALLFSLFFFEWTPADLWLQRLLFDEASGKWLWRSGEPITRFLLYDGPKGALVLFALGLLLLLSLARWLPRVAPHTRGMRIVLLSLILVPTCVGALKDTTNVACPRDVEAFGGTLPYVGVLRAYPEDRRPSSRQRCFPGGHASGGFALMSLYFLFGAPRARRRALGWALVAGWTIGTYKMVIGDHYFSHTLVSMLLAWLVINGVVLGEERLFRRSVNGVTSAAPG